MPIAYLTNETLNSAIKNQNIKSGAIDILSDTKRNSSDDQDYNIYILNEQI